MSYSQNFRYKNGNSTGKEYGNEADTTIPIDRDVLPMYLMDAGSYLGIS